MKKIKLSLSGSGTLFYFFVGALKRLTEEYEITEVIGTSGGSIIAGFLGAGYSINEIEKFCFDINLKKYIDTSFNPFDKFGILEGKKIENLLKSYLNISFSNCSIPVNITSTNITKKECFIFNKKNTPNSKLFEAIRKSLSIPFLFKWVQEGENIFVDGGILNNFPSDYFKEPTIGIKIESDWVTPENKKNWFLNTFGLNYALDLISLMMSAIEKKHIEDSIFEKLIIIKTSKSGTKFDYNSFEIQEMILEGYRITDERLKNDWN